MKAFFILCLAMAVRSEPEADPQFVVHQPYVPVVPHTYVQQPYMYSSLVKPLTYVKPVVPVVNPVVPVVKPVVPVVKPFTYVNPYTYTYPLTYVNPWVKPVVPVVPDVKVDTPVGVVAPNPITYNTVPYYTPLTYTHPAQIPKYHADSAGVKHTVFKREAEAESYFPYYTPYATPYATPYTPYVNQHYTVPYTTYTHPQMVNYQPYVYPSQVKNYANDFHAGTPNYANKGNYVANSGGALHIAKREAEPESQYLTYNTAAYNPYYTPYTYGSQTPYSPYTYASHYNTFPQMVNYQPYVYPSSQVKTYANDFHPGTPNYANKGNYVAQSAGAIHIAKREAEPESQYLGYSNYYNTYSPYINRAYTYGNHYNNYRSSFFPRYYY